MLDNGAQERLDGQLAQGDFYRRDHRQIFGCMAAMLGRRERGSRPRKIDAV